MPNNCNSSSRFFSKSLFIKSVILSTIASVILAASTACFAQDNADQSVVFVGPDNPDFKIIIKANPSTGYQWLLHNYNADLLSPVKSSYQDDPKLPKAQNLGAGVNQVWEFKIDDQAFAVPTITEISFVHLRPWDVTNSLSPKDDLVVKIIIDPTYKAKSSQATPTESATSTQKN